MNPYWTLKDLEKELAKLVELLEALPPFWEFRTKRRKPN